MAVLAVFVLLTVPSAAQTNVTFTVSANSDDADEVSGGTVYVTDGYSYMSSHVGYRFQNVTIPAGANVTSATLEIFKYGGGTTSFSVDLTAEDVDSAATFSASSYNISGRPRTSAQTLWSTGSTSYADGQSIVSPNFASSIQEVVDRSGWSSGNSLAIITTPNSGDLGLYKRSGVTTYAPRLHITYTTATADGHYKLDETSGTTAADSSGNGNDGTFVGGPTLGVAGIRDTAVDFDGTNYVEIPGMADEPQSITLAGWVNLDNADTYGGDVVSVGNMVILRVDDGAALSGMFYNGTSYETIAYGTSVEGTGWRHVVFSFDDATDTAKLYLDGALVSTSTIATSISYQNWSPNTRIGGHAGGNGDFDFDGKIDDVYIVSRAVSDAEVAEMYGLLGHWTFDEGTGTTAADTSLNANDAQFNTGTPTWVEGARGSALEFDGTNDAITTASFEPPAKGTVSMWWRSDGPPAARQRPWGLGGNFEMWQDPDGLVSMDLNTDGFQGGFITTSALYAAARWYHIVAQWDSADDSYEIYIDGELHKSGISSWNITQESSALLSFGTRTGSTERFTGAIDDFRVYNRHLRVDEIKKLYGLVGHWKLDENSGSTALDSSGLGNDGAYAGGVAPGGNGPYPGAGANAAEFDGNSGDEIDLPDLRFDFSHGITIALWAKPTTALSTGEFQAFFGLSNGASADHIWLGQVAGTVGLQLYLTDTQDGSSLRTVEDNAGFQTNEWVHCVATIDSSGNATLYRNGQVTKAGFYTSLPTSVQRTITALGNSSLNDNFTGSLHDVRLYNRSLSHPEIAELYGLVGQWKLDETSGVLANDSSGSGLDGVYQGGATQGVAGPYAGDGAIAAGFSGTTGDKVALPVMHFDFSNGFTMSTWYNASTLSGPYTDFFSLSNGSLVDDVWFGLDNSQGLDLFLSDTADGASFRGLLENSSPTTGTWYHAVATVDNTGNGILYRDGVVVASGYVGFPRDTSRAMVGIGETTFTHTLDGALFDVRLYNRPLSQDEVTAISSGASAGIRIIRWMETR